MLSKKIIIAIDGHSSSGKSSFARAVAERLGYAYVDTGAMYRAVALFALREQCIDDKGFLDKKKLTASLPRINIEFRRNAETGKNETWLNGTNVEREIRQMQVSANVSAISAISEVRRKLATQQQAMGAGKALVMDGRDIGTAVFPNAELKIFLTASPAVRALRRYNELLAKGETPNYQAIEQNIRERDYMDEHRSLSPLRPAPDACILDNSHMTPAEQMEWVMDKIKALH